MRRIAFINEKGGTCKTTLAVNVAAYLAEQKGQKVLLVDLDTQGHAGKSLGLDVRELEPNAFHLLTDPSLKLEDVVRPTTVENLSVVPAYKQLGEFPVAVAHDLKRAERLSERMREAKGYDVVVFDAPPSNGLVTRNIFLAATEIVVPVGLTYLALDGCAEVVSTVARIREELGREEPRVSLVVPTLYRKTSLADEILGKLRTYFPDTVASLPLGFNVKIDEAQSHGKTIWQYAPQSKGAQMLEQIAEEVFDRGAAKAAKSGGRAKSKAVA